jgi:hypothetical protein
MNPAPSCHAERHNVPTLASCFGRTTPTPKYPADAPFGSRGQIVVPSDRAPAYGLFPGTAEVPTLAAELSVGLFQ